MTVDYDGFKALRELNFYMDYRELRVVIGPNGAGKTTLLDVISGKVEPTAGRVVFGKDTSLVGRRENEIAAPRRRPEVPDAVDLRQPDGLGEPRAVVLPAEQGRLRHAALPARRRESASRSRRRSRRSGLPTRRASGRAA